MQTPASVRRNRLLAAVAPLALIGWAAVAGAAQAQDAPAGDQGNTVSEVVVTAQFREQNLQDTPIAITAVNAAMLEARSQTNVSEVAAQAPNVTLKPAGASFGSAMVAFIRGVGQTDFNFSQEPGVGIYVDDVYHATLTGSLLDLADIERVEVLRGPQGTLAGRNAIGGAIKIYSKKPENAFGGYVEGTYGSSNRIDAKAAANVVVVPDKLFARVTAATRHRDGYVDRLDYKCIHPTSPIRTFAVGTGCKLGEEGGQSYNALKVAVRWLPSDNLEINLAADGVNDNSEVQANTLLFARNNSLSLDGVPYGSLFVPYGPNSGDPAHLNDPYVSYASFVDPEGGPLESKWKPVVIPPINHYRTRGISAVVDWQISDNVSLKSVSGYRKFRNSFGEDTDASPMGVQMLLQTLHHEQWTQELRLNATLAEVVDLTLGAFYAKQEGDEEARVDLPYVGAGAPYSCLPGLSAPAPCGTVRNYAFDFIHGPDPTPSTAKALFAHGAWHVTDKLQLIGGIRYSEDKKTYTFHRHNPDGTLPCATPNLLDPLIPGCANWLVFGLDGQSSTFKGDRWDYRASISYEITDDVMVYAQYATGYKSGGSNARPFFGRGSGCPIEECQVTTFEPETLTAYEAGVKTTLFDRRLRFNATGFYNEYEDIILQLRSCPANSPGGNADLPCAMPTNIGGAHVKGAEFEAEAHPIDGLSMDASLSYLDFQYVKLPDLDPVTGLSKPTGVSIDGKTPFTPKWKWNFGAQYKFDLGGWGSLTPRIDVAHQSDIFSSAQNTPASVDPAKQLVPTNAAGIPTVPADRISGYTLWNGRVTWRSNEGDWEVALEVTNLGDKLYYHTYFDISGGGLPGYTSAQPGRPREWAIHLKKTF